MLEDIYCNVLYTGKMGTALIPKVIYILFELVSKAKLHNYVLVYLKLLNFITLNM